MENDQLNFKLRLRDRNPPCTIFIRHLDEKSSQNLNFYISTECREPNEFQNQGKFVNVSFEHLFNLEINVGETYSNQRRLENRI